MKKLVKISLIISLIISSMLISTGCDTSKETTQDKNFSSIEQQVETAQENLLVLKNIPLRGCVPCRGIKIKKWI